MSVILNALRSKEAASNGKQNSMPKHGLYVETAREDGLTSRARVAILLAILFLVSIFSFVRLGSEFLSNPSPVLLVANNKMPSATETAPVAVTETADSLANQPLMDAVLELKKARELFANNKFEESLILYERLIKQDPSNAMAMNDMGFILLKQNRVLEAESRFRAAVDINPKCAECFNNLGMLSTQLGRLDEAKEFLSRSIKIDPDYPEAHFNLAVLLQKEGDILTARAHFEDFLTLTPHKSAPVAIQVRQYLATVQVEEAEVLDEEAENT